LVINAGGEKSEQNCFRGTRIRRLQTFVLERSAIWAIPHHYPRSGGFLMVKDTEDVLCS